MPARLDGTSDMVIVPNPFMAHRTLRPARLPVVVAADLPRLPCLLARGPS